MSWRSALWGYFGGNYRLFYAQEPGSKQEMLVKIRPFPWCNSIQNRIKKWPKSYWIRIPYDMKNYADLGGCYHFAFSPLPFSPFPRHCYLKYPQNKRSRARDWGKGSGWKRVWASPTYRDSNTFKIRSFPTSNSPKVPKVGSLKWWIFLNSLFDPTYTFFNVPYFFCLQGPKQHKNCKPKNSCELKSFLFS